MVNWTSIRKFTVLYPKHDVYLRVRSRRVCVPKLLLAMHCGSASIAHVKSILLQNAGAAGTGRYVGR